MRRTSLALAIATAAICPAAGAQVTFEIICDELATDMAQDGSVVVGNTSDGAYETFRWTTEGGVERLGLATVPILGTGAGTPDVSADGTRISATILGADSTYSTQGLWTEGSGWQQLMPPPPPDGAPLDGSYGSSWGISDDGNTLVGLYWRLGQPDGSAHASAWTSGTGVVDLGSDGGNSRANDANADGSVIVGWDEADWGGWRPTVWVDGEKTILSEPDAFAEAEAVTPDGTVIVGQGYDPDSMIRAAAMWTWNGTSWDERTLGWLPGTSTTFGTVVGNDVTADGSMVVGYNGRSGPGTASGFIWTEAWGLIDVRDFLADNAVSVPSNFSIQTLSAITDDGSTMLGVGQDTTAPFAFHSFLVHIGPFVGVANPAELPPSPQHVRALANPASGETAFALELIESGTVRLDVFDASGRLVRHLLDASLPAGQREVAWDGRDAAGRNVPSGVYRYRLVAPGHRESHSVVVLR